LFVWNRLIFSLRLFSPCLPSRERWRHVRDNKWKYISKSIDVVYRGPSTRLLLVTSFEYLDLTFRSFKVPPYSRGSSGGGDDDKVCARQCPQSNRWPTLWTFIDLLYSVWLSSDPILPIVYPLYVYILAPPPFTPTQTFIFHPFWCALTHTQIREFDRERTNSWLSSLFGLDPDGTYLDCTHHSPRLLDLHTHTHTLEAWKKPNWLTVLGTQRRGGKRAIGRRFFFFFLFFPPWVHHQFTLGMQYRLIYSRGIDQGSVEKGKKGRKKEQEINTS
jgi:hypothetical protein